MKYTERIRRLESEGAFAVLAKAKKLEAEGRSIIHMQIGEPDFDTPKNICEAGVKAIHDGHTHYCPSGGIPEAREVIAAEINKTRKIDTVKPENIVVWPGCKPAIFSAMMAIVDEGDEIIVPNPGYPTYRSLTKFLGAKAVPVQLLEEHDFRFRVEDLKALITPKTKMMIINSPENPTGGVLTMEDLEAIYALAKKHDLWILADEIYSRLVYDAEFRSVLSIPGAAERTVVVDGMSKTYAMTGWRLGYSVVPKKMAEYLFTFAINNFSSTATFAQYAMIEAITGPQDDVNMMLEEFRKRREVIVDGLNAIDGISCLKPEGAFYVFPNIKGTGLTSQQFVDKALDEAGVACLAGTSFGDFGEGYVRFSYANSIDNIKEALSRIKKVLAGQKV